MAYIDRNHKLRIQTSAKIIDVPVGGFFCVADETVSETGMRCHWGWQARIAALGCIEEY